MTVLHLKLFMYIHIKKYIYVYIHIFTFNTSFLATFFTILFMYGFYRPGFTVYTVIIFKYSICIYGLCGALSKVSTSPCSLKVNNGSP